MNTTQKLITIDGMLVDEETGEIVGIDGKPQFRIVDADSLNFVLKKILTASAELEAIDNSTAVIRAKAVLENAESMKKDAQRRLDGLTYRFQDEIGEYAKTQLKGSSKTFKTLYGSVSFTTRGESLKVKDQTAAIAWAMTYLPDAIKVTREFQISKMPPELKADALKIIKSDRPLSSYLEAFDRSPATEKIEIKTGVA